MTATTYPLTQSASSSTVFSLPGFIGLYFGLRVCITFLFFRADPPTGAMVSTALNLLIFLPVLFYSAGAATLTLREMLRARPFRYVLAFLALALISLLWSETASRIVALGYWTALAADVAMVILVLRADPTGHASESLLKGFVAGVFLLAIVAWSAPTNTDLRLGDDEYLNPNAIGFACAFGALICQHLAPQGARWKTLGVLLVLTLVRSLSKTSILAFLIVESLYLTRSKTLTRTTKLAIASGFLLLVALFWNLFAAYYALYTNTGDEAETLTGRVGIWLLTLTKALEEPWFGHGFHSFRTVIPPFGAFQPSHAHNEILNQFFLFGLAGVALLITLYVSIYRQTRLTPANPLALFTRSVLFLVLIRGLTDTERFDLSFPLWAITAITVALAQSTARPEANPQELTA